MFEKKVSDDSIFIYGWPFPLPIYDNGTLAMCHMYIDICYMLQQLFHSSLAIIVCACVRAVLNLSNSNNKIKLLRPHSQTTEPDITTRESEALSLAQPS